MKSNKVKSICIVGGGTAGWMAATLLNASLRGSAIQITLIESADIPSIGVGESTVPSIIDFIKTCQIDLIDFIRATSASFKLGIRFDDWKSQGHQYFHPFGKVGKDVNGFDFYHVWLKTQNEQSASAWLDFSANAVMAKNQRFVLPPAHGAVANNSGQQNWVFSSLASALHLDAKLVAEYLRKTALIRGVKRIESTVKKAHVNQQSFIQSVELTDGTQVKSDIFIDCSGFQSVLLGQALQVNYDDWSHYLPCDKAVTVQSENVDEPNPYTVATALDAGWSWKIPLQHRTGNGYVYASQFCSDDKAASTLLNAIKGKTLTEPKVIPFKTGKRTTIWQQNCLALGLAAGFVEPLESTAIHLVYRTLVHFIRHFPYADCDASERALVNAKIDKDYEEVRDFIILHYITSGRDDTDFWRFCKTIEAPKRLKEQLERFKKRGELTNLSDAFFSSDSWYSILEGMGIRPQSYHPLVDAFSQANLYSVFQNNTNTIHKTVMQMPSHQAYLDSLLQVKQGM